MPQTDSLIETLKTCLKAGRKTYADVARVLHLSEASVKRLFARKDMTLERLDAIAQMLGLEISDIVQKMNDARERIESLTAQQEREITEDLKLMLVLVCMFNHWTLAQITEFYAIGEAECVGKLIRLDQLRLIELMPGNRLRLLVGQNFKWLKNGPIEHFFRKTIGKEFFDRGFEKSGESLQVLNGMLSPASRAEMERKSLKLAREFDELVRQDAGKPFAERHGATFVVAMRNWDYGLFEHMRRSDPPVRA